MTHRIARVYKHKVISVEDVSEEGTEGTYATLTPNPVTLKGGVIIFKCMLEFSIILESHYMYIL